MYPPCDKSFKVKGIVLIPKEMVIDYELITVTFHLKPWKGKVAHFVSTYHTNIPLDTFVKGVISRLKADPKYKRRTITGYTLTRNLNIKL